MSALAIVYEDDWLLVVDKPANLLMHPSWLDPKEKDTLAGRIKQYYNETQQDFKVHTVHRLDRPTSGLVLVPKTGEVARNLAEQFSKGTVEKVYWAICRGFIGEEILVDYPLKEELDKIADKHAAKDKEAQSAVTLINRLGISELAIPVSRYNKCRISWVECRPKTGRKHQIRRHLKHLRHPIVGDTRHGCRHVNKALNEALSISGLALRAVSLTFEHPKSRECITVTSHWNDQWQQMISRFGWSL